MNEVLFENVSKRFGNKIAVCDFSVKFEKGKIYGLVGKNGAGKTTVMKMICGLLDSSEGKVSCYPDNIGALIEETGAYKNFNAYDNLAAYETLFEKPKKDKIEKMIEMVGLKNDKRKFEQYSLGMKKRLGIAMALMSEPDILILDEPTSGLDIDGIREVREIVKNYKTSERIIIISSHDTRDLAKLCDELVIIHNGKMICEIKDVNEDPIELENRYLNLIQGIQKG